MNKLLQTPAHQSPSYLTIMPNPHSALPETAQISPSLKLLKYFVMGMRKVSTTGSGGGQGSILPLQLVFPFPDL